MKYYDGSYAAEGDDVTGNTKLKDTFLWAGLLGLLGLLLASSLAFKFKMKTRKQGLSGRILITPSFLNITKTGCRLVAETNPNV